MYNYLLKYFTVFLCCLLLLGCAESNGIGVHMHVRAANYLNPNINGQSSPVTLSFYQLKSTASFKQATYFQLAQNASAVLGNDLIDMQQFEVRPNQHITYPISVPPNTKYIGITAGYRDIDRSTWRAVIAVPKNKDHWHVVHTSHQLSAIIDLQSKQLKAYI